MGVGNAGWQITHPTSISVLDIDQHSWSTICGLLKKNVVSYSCHALSPTQVKGI